MVKIYIYPGLDFSLKCLHISHIILPSTQVSFCSCMLIASLGWYLSYIKTHSVAGVTRVRKTGSYSHPSSSPPLLPLCLNDRLLPWSAALSSWHWPRESSRRSLRDTTLQQEVIKPSNQCCPANPSSAGRATNVKLRVATNVSCCLLLLPARSSAMLWIFLCFWLFPHLWSAGPGTCTHRHRSGL